MKDMLSDIRRETFPDVARKLMNWQLREISDAGR